MKGKIPLLVSGMAVSAWPPRKKVINVIPFLSLTAVTHTCTVAPVSDKTLTLHLTILISLCWAQDGPKGQIHSEQCESFWGVHGQEMQRRGKHEVYNRTEQENKDVQNRENKKLFRNRFVRRTDGWKQRRQQLSLLPRDGVGGREAVACHSSPRRRCYAHLLGVCNIGHNRMRAKDMNPLPSSFLSTQVLKWVVFWKDWTSAAKHLDIIPVSGYISECAGTPCHGHMCHHHSGQQEVTGLSCNHARWSQKTQCRRLHDVKHRYPVSGWGSQRLCGKIRFTGWERASKDSFDRGGLWKEIKQ